MKTTYSERQLGLFGYTARIHMRSPEEVEESMRAKQEFFSLAWNNTAIVIAFASHDQEEKAT